MEIQRLVLMDSDYDIDLFNQIYHEVKPLKQKLVSQIDPRRYGVDKTIIESWFDDKFLFVFQKYHKEKEPNILKGFIISSLQQFKYRCLRKAYTSELLFHTSMAELDGEDELKNKIVDSESYQDSPKLDMANNWFKDNLSSDAYFIFSIQLNPPPYIITRLPKSNAKIPTHLLVEYLGLPELPKSTRYVNKLRREIKQATKMAREHFNSLATFN